MAFANMQPDDSPFLQIDLTRESIESLLDYAYTRQCTLTSNNINKIIDAAKLCQMTSLFHYCCEYLIENLNNDNCFTFYNFAKNHSNFKLLNITYEYLM